MTQQQKMDPRISFGERLRELRQQLGISQEALAARAGLDRTYISGCERGQRNVSLLNIHKISAALEASPSELLLMPNTPALGSHRQSNSS